MPSTIVVNQNNIVQDGNNNTFVYNFPNSVSFPNHEITVQTVSMYYSWTNINASPLGNNTFSYNWTVGGTTTSFTVTIPDGLYEISTINQYLQSIFIANGHYLVNSANQNVYYAELIVNPSIYAVQVNTYLVPTSLPSGWTQPSNFAGYPTTAKTPVLTFPANFNKVVGFTAGYSTPNSTSSTQSVTSNLATGAQVQQNSSIFIASTMISNPYSSPSSIIYALSPNVGFGELIYERPSEFCYNDLLNGTYNQLRLSILGLDGNPIKLLDSNTTITLAIREREFPRK
jgi:hypothetical protein